MKNNELTYEKAKETLNEFYNIARRDENTELTCRLSRAMIAFESDPTKEIFAENVLEEYITYVDLVKDLAEKINYRCGLKFSLESSGNHYTLKEGTNVIMEGDLDKIKTYLRGVEFASLVCVKKDSAIISFFKQRIGMPIKATVKKKAKDNYFSQEERILAINILSVEGNVISYQANTYNICPSGVKMGGTDISSAVLTYTVDETIPFSGLESIVLSAMIKTIDNSIKENLLNKYKSGSINHVNSDLIIDIKPEELRRFGWTNEGLITERYTINYSF